MVYIDHNVFNYTEANNGIMESDNEMIFGIGKLNSCRWIVMYMICLSIYPHCNVTTQSLQPPCMDNCLEYNDMCSGTRVFLQVVVKQRNYSLLESLILNCSAPFRAFDSVSVDTENCFNFSCKLICNIIMQINNDSDSCSQEKSRKIKLNEVMFGCRHQNIYIYMYYGTYRSILSVELHE